MTGAMATSRFTPPGATAPTQSNNAARRGAWCCTCCWAAQQAARVTPGESPSRPGRMWWEDPPASSSCAPPALPSSRDHQSRGIGSRQHHERPRTAHDPTRQSLLAAVRRLRSANERARTSPRTKQKSDTQRPPRPFNTRTDRLSNRPRDGRERDHVRAPQRCAVARLLTCW